MYYGWGSYTEYEMGHRPKLAVKKESLQVRLQCAETGDDDRWFEHSPEVIMHGDGHQPEEVNEIHRDFAKFPKIRSGEKIKGLMKRYGMDGPVKFYATTKLHGTNACVAMVDGKIHAQSKERILRPDEEDNMGFRFWVEQNEEKLRTMLTTWKLAAGS